MSERLAERDAEEARHAETDPEAPPGAPRWAGPVAVVVGFLIVAALVALHLTGAVGPGAH